MAAFAGAQGLLMTSTPQIEVVQKMPEIAPSLPRPQDLQAFLRFLQKAYMDRTTIYLHGDISGFFRGFKANQEWHEAPGSIFEPSPFKQFVPGLRTFEMDLSVEAYEFRGGIVSAGNFRLVRVGASQDLETTDGVLLTRDLPPRTSFVQLAPKLNFLMPDARFLVTNSTLEHCGL